MLDHENKKEMDSMTTQWLEQLNSLQDKHGEDISNIHVQAEKCLVKDYLVYRIFFFTFWTFCRLLSSTSYHHHYLVN